MCINSYQAHTYIIIHSITIIICIIFSTQFFELLYAYSIYYLYIQYRYTVSNIKQINIIFYHGSYDIMYVSKIIIRHMYKTYYLAYICISIYTKVERYIQYIFCHMRVVISFFDKSRISKKKTRDETCLIANIQGWRKRRVSQVTIFATTHISKFFY